MRDYILYDTRIQMNFFLILICFIVFLLVLAYVFFYFFSHKIREREIEIISLFRSRSDIIPAIYESSKFHITQHNEIFQEILTLRKKEFSLMTVSHSIESFIELQWKMHHEINFIFQVCNKNPQLIKSGDFLYTRDIMMQKSNILSKEIKKYRRIIEIYNMCINYKNYSLIWLTLPFFKKASI